MTGKQQMMQLHSGWLNVLFHGDAAVCMVKEAEFPIEIG